MNADEKQIADFLKSKGLTPEEFTKEEKQNSKTPDFRVLKDDKLAFFCEIKSISADESISWNTIFGLITKKIHEAVKQFDAVNRNVRCPNVLVFLNHDKSCKFKDLINAVTGYIEIGDNEVVKFPYASKFADGRIKEEKNRIHLFIWTDEFSSKRGYIFNMTKAISKKVCFKALYSYFPPTKLKILNI